jgi:hypothetical protein
MSEGLPSYFIDLVHDALLKSFWRKNSLLNFLRRHKISENFLGSWQETETKRVFVGRLLPKLEKHQKGSSGKRGQSLLSTQLSQSRDRLSEIANDLKR